MLMTKNDYITTVMESIFIEKKTQFVQLWTTVPIFTQLQFKVRLMKCMAGYKTHMMAFVVSTGTLTAGSATIQIQRNIHSRFINH